MTHPRSMRSAYAWLISAWLLMPGSLPAAEYNGLVSVENYYTNDSSPAQDFDFLRMRLRFDAVKLDEAGRLSFHFSGRERLRLSSNDTSSNIKNEQIDLLNLEYAGLGDRLDLVAGRLKPKELPIEQVDGINLVYHFTAAGIGLFGGVKPDPYTQMFTADFPLAGAYLFYRTPDLAANLAFTQLMFKGKTDRQYLYGYAQYYPLRTVLLYSSLTVDIAQDTRNLRLTNAVAEVSYRSNDSASLTVGYNQYRAFQLFSSMDFPINTDRQQSYYIRGDYRFFGRNSLFGKVERQTRDYLSIETQRLHSDIYQAGLRNGDLWESGLNLTVSSTWADSFGLAYRSYEMELSRFNWDWIELTLNGATMKTAYDLTNDTDRIVTYGASSYFYLSRQWNFSVSYEGNRTTDFATNTILARVTYRFKSGPSKTEKKSAKTETASGKTR